MTPAEYRTTAGEAGTQGAIVAALRLLGFRVLVTSRRRPRRGGGDGADRGIADLLVRRERPGPAGEAPWVRGAWASLEVKRPIGGRLSPEQRELEAVGSIVVVRSVEEALGVLGVLEAAMRRRREGDER